MSEENVDGLPAEAPKADDVRVDAATSSQKLMRGGLDPSEMGKRSGERRRKRSDERQLNVEGRAADALEASGDGLGAVTEDDVASLGVSMLKKLMNDAKTPAQTQAYCAKALVDRSREIAAPLPTSVRQVKEASTAQLHSWVAQLEQTGPLLPIDSAA